MKLSFLISTLFTLTAFCCSQENEGAHFYLSSNYEGGNPLWEAYQKREEEQRLEEQRLEQQRLEQQRLEEQLRRDSFLRTQSCIF